MKGQSAIIVVGLCVAVATLLSSVHSATIAKRAVAGGSSNHSVKESDQDKICHFSTPCGWAVYEPYTRQINYFLRNTCRCSENKKCLRTNDDLSTKAYVYKCREAPASTPTQEHSWSR
ncbi:uncharacterized protein LOC132197343 [Neocloeon triangulifer]|uniref:uncharacterized protein LOC132197343 n=1 Tax=Neocloeon triangulifer TaxID=2078957 RepID=UPI00286EF390|nr:uncharacterized protein LOC132197343 [Neocloeon triangulifer]